MNGMFPDINECDADDKGGCHSDADCVNMSGSHICNCRTGYTGAGTMSCQGNSYQLIRIEGRFRPIEDIVIKKY